MNDIFFEDRLVITFTNGVHTGGVEAMDKIAERVRRVLAHPMIGTHQLVEAMFEQSGARFIFYVSRLGPNDASEPQARRMLTDAIKQGWAG